MADYTIKRNDTAPAIAVTLSDANGPIDLTGAKAIHIYLKIEGKPVVKTQAMEVTAASEGKAKYVWREGDLAEAGVYQMEFEIIWADDTVTTIPNTGYLELEVVPDLAEPEDVE